MPLRGSSQSESIDITRRTFEPSFEPADLERTPSNHSIGSGRPASAHSSDDVQIVDPEAQKLANEAFVRRIQHLRNSSEAKAADFRQVVDTCPTLLPSVYAERMWYAWVSGGRSLLADCMIEICELLFIVIRAIRH